MEKLYTEILHKIVNAVDSDDIQSTAELVESNLSKEQLDKLQKMLKEHLSGTTQSFPKSHSIKQFFAFLE